MEYKTKIYITMQQWMGSGMWNLYYSGLEAVVADFAG